MGSEIQESRLCLLVSTLDLNVNLRTAIFALVTFKGFATPFRIPFTHAKKKFDSVRSDSDV